ncbi:MAG TPA: hypothetical protein VIM30_14195 [Candidatus Limnocylindrales bacterium]
MLPRSPRVLRRAGMSVLAGLLIVASGCGQAIPTPPATPSPSPVPPAASESPISSPSTTPSSSPSPSQDSATVYREIEAQVVAIRGLQPTRSITPTILDEAQLATYIKDQFAKDNPPAQTAANERLLKGLGLLPPDSSLADLEISMLQGQVAGLYSPDDRALYIVSKSGGLGPVEQVTFAHEFTHALQDQHFDLTKFGVDTVGQGDQSLARLSLVEGDATTVMSVWAQAHLTPEQLLQLAGQSLDPAQLAAFGKLPPILRETLLFPYQEGLQFVLGLQLAGGWKAVDAAFAAPPNSTEQVIHPEKFATHEKAATVELRSDLPAGLGEGWKAALQDTLGELELRIWLTEVARLPQATAAADAAGWGGDRVELLEGPAGKWAVVLGSIWDTAADATEFANGANAAVNVGGLTASVADKSASTSVTVLIASDSSTLIDLSRVLGLVGV